MSYPNQAVANHASLQILVDNPSASQPADLRYCCKYTHQTIECELNWLQRIEVQCNAVHALSTKEPPAPVHTTSAHQGHLSECCCSVLLCDTKRPLTPYSVRSTLASHFIVKESTELFNCLLCDQVSET